MLRLVLIALLATITLAFQCGRRRPPPPPSHPTPTPTVTVTPTPEPSPSPSPSPTPPIPEKTIVQQITIGEGQELVFGRVLFHAITPGPPILLANGSTLRCEGTVFEETTAEAAPEGHSPLTHQSVFAVMQDLAGWKLNGAASSNITIIGCTIRGVRRNFNSSHQAISLGNCSNCLVDGVTIDRTRAIGVQFGGSADLGHFASNSRVINSTFIGVASQNLALSNGQDIEFAFNRFINPGSPEPGAPGSSPIDLEPNNSGDRILRVRIHHNTIDAGGSNWTSGNAILVQATAWFSPRVEDVIVEDNQIVGGSMTLPITNSITHGIYVSGGANQQVRNVVIRRNSIVRASAGIRVEGTGIVVEDNTLDSVGGGGTAGFQVYGSGNTIRRNSFKCSVQPCDERMTVEGQHTVEGNTGWTVRPQ